MYNLKLGCSVKALSDDFFEKANKMVSLGFDTIDFDLCANGFLNREEEFIKLNERFQFLNKIGLKINAIHIPYGTEWDISIIDEKAMRYSIDNVKKTIVNLECFNPNCFVLHGSFEWIKEKDRKQTLKNLGKAYKEIQSITKIDVALENLPRTAMLRSSSEIKKLSKMVRNLKICLDVNHFLLEESHEGIIEISKCAKIITTHISDHDYINERHWLPTKGKINWQRTIVELKNIGYNGVFNYEVSPDITLDEVKENYSKLILEYFSKI